MPPSVSRHVAAVLVLALFVPFLAACGDDDSDKSARTTMSITTTDVGKRFKMAAPKAIEGGVVKVKFRNASKLPHEAQIITLDGHTVKEALKIVEPEKVVLPDWLHAEGGVAATQPGKSGTATIKLPPGDYAVIDTESDEGPPPSQVGASATFKVTGDNGGEISDTSAKVEGKDKGDDEFEFVTSGLKAGTNELTFDNESDEIHHVIAFPIRGNATLAEVKKFLSTMGRPSGPPPLDFDEGDGTSIIDGKRKLVTRVTLQKGRSVLLCFLTDRDGKGKSHFAEGMIEEVDLK